MILRRDRALLAIDIVLDVAFHAGRGTEATGGAEIADRLQAQRRGIEPVLQALSRAGILDSTRGPKGGYRLARAARGITLAEVVEAVLDGGEDEAAGRLSTAVTRPFWQSLEALLRDRLAATTVADLLRQAAAAGLRRPATEPLNFAI
ncbi:RrF2 family transcriptional regulator [Falsiroseomonas tokyonensis]|uniref:RrF2 family transcriptional regulator n=1 Tax=Falsiroseomonas tokyonensis TaxID=430521 RepID=A0ABV7BX42_9PROT|nr:Rrf2 family transcriptional regulator [Falsiroseomonas tokyonensis]MBU8539214.1 Rrf2 family transcriptional regulator [Falsiroseomonas tokyonensis]